MDKGRTQTNRPKDKKSENYAQVRTPARWHRQTIFVKKRKRKRTRQHWWLRRCISTRTWWHIKKSKESQIVATSSNFGNMRTNRKTTKTMKHKWEENSCIDISSDKLERLHMKRPKPSYKRETSRERLYLARSEIIDNNNNNITRKD